MTIARVRSAPPLRFLGLVLGGWICLRAAILAPGWWAPGRDSLSAPPAAARARAILAATAPAAKDRASSPRDTGAPPAASAPRRHSLIRDAPYKGNGQHHAADALPAPGSGMGALPSVLARASAPAPAQADPAAVPARPRAAPPPALALLVPAPSPVAGHWSGSAWLLARHDRAAAPLAPGGSLGGSQAGARLLYRVNGDPARPLALSARLYLPLRRAAGAEAAAGIDWQPLARLPVHLLGERRQALGDDGRSAFVLTLYGGTSRPLPHGLRLDAYGQAGVVGVRARDLFADGTARLAAPLGPVELGGTLRGAAQPGAARLDAGPEVSVRLHAGGAALRLAADWRFRVAGDAAPDSGPALTLAADF